MSKHSQLTQQYSTFGDKLLQHTDVLYSIQNDKKFKPITVQLVPTEICDLNCHYCSVGNRDKTKFMSMDSIIKVLSDFRTMGAKALEITGGGNPLLYPHINEVIDFAYQLGYDIGIITNSQKPMKYLHDYSIDKIKWIRISLSALDFDINTVYELKDIDHTKLGLSYIINEKTTEDTIQRISFISSRFDVKFVRMAPDCLNDDSLTIKDKWNDIIEKYDRKGNIFLKDIDDNFLPFECCYVGLIRPYVNYSGVYICSSFVLKTRKYEPEWKMCELSDVISFWYECNERFKNGESPYNIDVKKCFHCYYYNNNKLLHTVANEMPDRNFA